MFNIYKYIYMYVYIVPVKSLDTFPFENVFKLLTGTAYKYLKKWTDKLNPHADRTGPDLANRTEDGWVIVGPVWSSAWLVHKARLRPGQRSGLWTAHRILLERQQKWHTQITYTHRKYYLLLCVYKLSSPSGCAISFKMTKNNENKKKL